MQTPTDINQLKLELKRQIIEELNLEGMKPEDIVDDAPLFGEGLGLDSIDSLELVVIMERYHGVNIKDEKLGREVLKSVDTMAAYIMSQKATAE